MSYALGRPLLLNLEAFAQVTKVHPDLVTHFVTLGLLEPVRDATGGLWFDQTQRAKLARIQRLRALRVLRIADPMCHSLPWSYRQYRTQERTWRGQTPHTFT